MGSNYQDILNQYLAADPATNPNIFETPISKAQQVEEATDQKRWEAYVLSGMTADGSGYKSASQRDRDYLTMTPNQFRVKYGDEAAMNLQADVSNMDAARRGDIQGRRDGITMLGDTVNSAGMGFVNSLGGIAALGLGLVNDDAGVWASRKLGDLNEFTQGLQSDQLNAARRSYGAQQELDARDNKANYEKNRKEYGDTVAGLWRVGADVVNSLGNSFDTPMLAQDTVASGVGSLFAGGPIAKGLKVIGSAAVKGAVLARPSLLLSEAAGKAVSVGSKAAMPTAIGLMEGGGAYQQTAEAAYEQLRGREDLTEDQKIEMANNAALMAAAIQAPVGAATGLLVSRFESSPLRVPTVRGAASNVVRETVEEGVQSGSGQLAQNVALSQEVNPEQDLLQGVGEQAGLGALGGLGAAGVVQTPGAALRASIETAKLPFRAAGAALSYAGDRVEARNQRVQDEILQGLHDEATVTAPDAQVEAGQIIEAADAPEEVKTTARDFVAQTMERLSNSATIQEVAKRVTSATADIRERLTALTELSSMVREGKTTQDQETPEILQGSSIQSIKDVVANAVQSESVQKAVEQGKKLYEEYAPGINGAMKNALVKFNTLRAKVGSQGTSNSPSVEAEITNAQSELNEGTQLVLSMAEQVPEQVDPEVADQILYHSENNGVNLTTQQKVTLRSASATARAVQQGSELASKYGLANAETVSRQVLTDKPSEGSSLSLYGHIEAIRSAYNANNDDLAAERLTDLRNFAQSQSNKVAAFNEALIGGNTSSHRPVPYNAHIGKGKFRPTSTSKVNLSPTNINSVKIAQQVAVEAVTLANAVNNLSDAFPDLGVEHVTIPLLDASLDGEAATVAQEYRTGKRMVPVNTTDGVQTGLEPVADVGNVESIGAEVVEEQGGQSSELGEIEASITNPDQVISEQTDQAEAEPDVAETQQSEEISQPEQIEETAPAKPNQEEETNAPQEQAPEGVQEKPATTTDEQEAQTVEKVYPALLGSKTNRLRRAFKIPKIKPTRTFAVDSPISIVRDGLKNETAFRQLIDGDLNRKFTPEIAEAYRQYLQIGDALLKTLDNRLQAFLNKPATKKAGIDNATTWLNGQAVNIVDQNEDGSYSYNQKLIENAVLAGLQWYLKMNQYGGNLDEKDVRSLLRLPADAVLPEGLVDDINNAGMGPAEMARSLSREIQRFWGLEADSSQPRNFSEGVPEGVAKEILVAMLGKEIRTKDKNGKEVLSYEGFLLQRHEVDISNISTDENITKLNRYRMNTVKLEQERSDGKKYVPVLEADATVRQFPTAIEKAVLTETEEVHYLGELPPAPSKTQLRNDAVKNTPDQLRSLEKQQAVEHRLNMPFIGMIQQMGEAMVLRLFGGGDIENIPLNQNHKKTLAGQNLTLQSAYLSIMSLVTEAQNKADLDGIDVGDLAIHFAYNDTVVNRAQMLGKDNPQSNKLMREAILPTWKVLDLTDGRVRDQFFMGLAQALDVKVHTQPRDESMSDLQKKLEGFTETLSAMADTSPLKFTPELIDTMKSEGVNSVAGLHALMEYARYQASEDKSAFRTSIYFEADGVTNGVINAMALFSSGPFTSEWLENIARGGYNVGETPLSLAQIRTRFAKASADLYGLAGTKTTEYVKRLRNKYRSNAEVTGQFNAIRDLLTEFLGDSIRVNKNNDLIVDRRAVKNPLTITFYVSGAKGIAGNIVDELVSKIYERMSLTAQRVAEDPDLTEAQAFYGGDAQSAEIKFKRLMSNLNAVVANRLVMNDGELVVENIIKGRAESFGDPKAFTFPKVGIDTIRQNMLHAFVEPMVDGITDTVGKDLIDNLTIIKTQIQSWSLIGKFAYQAAYNEAILEKRKANPEMSKNELLSRREEQQIMKKVWKQLPFFSTGSQNFLFGMKQAMDVRTEFARGFNDELNTPAFGYTPDDAGVAGIPGITIGTGDGQTVLNAIADPDMPEGFLQIFDGIHSSVADMETMGRVANKAVFGAWQNNPLGDLSKAFSAFVSQVDLSALNEEQRKALTKSLFPPRFWRTAQPADVLKKALQSWAKRGKEAAQGIAERHGVMAQVQSSVDQMAGAAAPHQITGIILSGSPEQKAAAMERLRKGEQIKQVDTTGPIKKVWNGVVVTIDFEGMKPGDFKIEKDMGIEGDMWFNYITVDGDKIAGSFITNGVRAEWLNITSEKGNIKNNMKHLKDVFNHILKVYPNLKELQALRTSGARAFNDEQGERDPLINYLIKDGKLVLDRKILNVVPVDIVEPTFKQATPALMAGMLDKTINKITSDRVTRALVRDVVRSGRVDDYQIHIGSREELLTKAADLGIQIPPNRAGFEGFMHPQSKSIFVVNGNPETILHELIHAATYETLQAHYDGQDVGVDAKAAIERIESLMEQFKNSELEGEAFQNALDEMERQAVAGNQAGELNEFMAWALSNADLSKQLKETKIDKALRIARSVIQSLKQLLWGGKRSAAVKDDMFTNLRFNTNIIMRSQQTVAETASNGVLFHDPNFGQSSRLTDLMERMKSKITDYANTNPVTREINRQKLNPALANASRVALGFQNAGFNMTKQEQMAFIRMVAIMGTDAQLDANSTLRMQELFTHVGKHLSLESFMRDPSQNDSADIDQATQKFNILMGKFASRKDAYDRSVVLPAFVALATVNEDFRKILSSMEMPKTKYAEWSSLSNILDNIGDTSIDNLSRWVSGEGVLTKDVQTALDGLMEQMLDTAQESELYIEKFTNPVGNGIDRVNQTVIEAMDWVGKKAAENVESIRTNNPDAKIRIKMAESLRTITGLLNEENGHASAVALMSAANRTKVWRPMYDLLKDLVGRTAENAQVYDLIKIARTWVNGIRQQYREQFPRIVNSKFSRELTDDEQSHLYRGLGETGFASLMRGNSIERVLELMSDQAARDVEVRNQISKIEGLSPENAKRIESKARQLAKYMISKKNDQANLLRNAEAIAHLLNENGVQGTVTTQPMIDAIDHLVSVLAFNELSDASKTSLSSLVQSEAKGLTFIMSYLQGQDEIDRAKATGNARFNHFKGHMPSEAAQGVSLLVSYDGVHPGSNGEPKSEGAKKLLEKSYTRLRVYSGSSKDPTAGKRGYYFAPVSGRAPFAQGIMQNVQQTVSGVDKATGFSTGLTAGIISDPLLVKKITADRTKETGLALMPLFDGNGNLFAYERSIDPIMLDRLQIKTNMAQAMGIRSGRQVEESLSHELNKTLIDRLRDMYDKDVPKDPITGKRGGLRQIEYIDLFKSKDPIHKDAVKIFSNETMEYIRARFPEGFFVRKDMIDDAIGYRSASIGDAWTGNSRWSPATQEQVKKVLMGMFGNKAYQRAVQAESLLQNIMQDIRVVIVIKSIVVPMANAASNVYQLIGRGVPATQIFRSIPKKTSEIEAWHKSRIRQIEAEAELMATTDILERRRLEAEIQTIKDSHKRLSIWPLLQAGEFSSISDAGSRDDILLSEGKLSEYLERAVNKLPKSVQTAGKYAIISKDTALFRALQKSVEYGDFVAKSILYDDLIKRQGKTKEEALGRVTEEFVNYDRLPGRDRAYLESIGLLWFYNFKIRSSKVAVSMIRNNPVHSLISMSLPLPISGIGTSLEDNLWAALYDGRASNSVGFGMAFRAPGLLPLNNLLW